MTVRFQGGQHMSLELRIRSQDSQLKILSYDVSFRLQVLQGKNCGVQKWCESGPENRQGVFIEEH
jgi:hypothetical protein